MPACTWRLSKVLPSATNTMVLPSSLSTADCGTEMAARFTSDDLHVCKHVGFESAVRISDLGANLHGARVGIDDAVHKNHAPGKRRLRKRGHCQFHFLSGSHALEIFFKDVCVD